MHTNKNLFDPFSFDSLSKNIIGIDDVLSKIQKAMDYVPRPPTYPPFNVRKVDDNHYILELAVAGFGKSDLDVEFGEGSLTVKGHVASDEGVSEEFVFKGIATRDFIRKFTLADNVVVQNADFYNGLLKIFLERLVPPEAQTRKVTIGEHPTTHHTTETTERKRTHFWGA